MQTSCRATVLLMLAQWLQACRRILVAVFQYLTFRAVMAALTALLIGIGRYLKVIAMLRALKIGHSSRLRRGGRT